jgi:hypothetical protein
MALDLYRSLLRYKLVAQRVDEMWSMKHRVLPVPTYGLHLAWEQYNHEDKKTQGGARILLLYIPIIWAQSVDQFDQEKRFF